MPNILTKDQQNEVSRLKHLARVLNDFVFVIENDQEPALNIQEAVKAIEYYLNKFQKHPRMKQETPATTKPGAIAETAKVKKQRRNLRQERREAARQWFMKHT